MILSYGFIFMIFFFTGCQSFPIFHSQVVESDVKNELKRAMLFLKQQEYQKAAQAYLHIAQKYPEHPHAQEAGILGQELQRMVSLIQSISVSKEAALKDLKGMMQEIKQLSEQNDKLKRLEKENMKLRSEFHQMEEHLEKLTTLEEENRKLLSDIDQLRKSFKELHDIEQEMRQTIKPPPRSEEPGK